MKIPVGFVCCYTLMVLGWASSTKAAPLATPVQGQPSQGGWQEWQLAPQVIGVSYNQQTIPLSTRHSVVVGFGRDAKAIQALTLHLANGQTQTLSIELTQRQYDEQAINGLPPKTVTPDQQTQDQIWRDIQAAKQARQIYRQQYQLQKPFCMPTGGVISGVYGSRRILNGKPKRPHFGIDIAALTGTPIYAPNDGIITLSQSMVLSGETVMIDHSQGLRSTVMHLNQRHVELHQVVKQGDLIGTVGTTGRSTGPHLHWGMSWQNVRLDPALLFDDPIRKGQTVQSNCPKS